MAQKNEGWKQLDEKFPENEIEDNFAGFFSEAEAENKSAKGKKRRSKNAGPDILAVAPEENDSGFVIKEVVSLEETEKPAEKEPETAVAEPEETTAQEEAVLEEAPMEVLAEEAPEKEEQVAEAPEEETQPVELEYTEEAEAPEAEPIKEAQKKKKFFKFERANKIIDSRRKHKYAAIVGAALIVLAIFGFVFVFSGAVSGFKRIIDNSAQKEAVEWKIYPLVMLDPTTFDDPSQLDEVVLLKASLWSTLLNHRTEYKYDENGMLQVPASDLDVAAKNIFGDKVTLNHQTFSEGYEFFYIYNEETSTYSVPVSGQTASYTPKIVKITKNGDIYTMIVGYVAPTTLWNMSEDGTSYESVPDKYVYYDMQKVGSEFIVAGVRSIPADELPDDLEIASQQSLNQTQYFDYDELYQEYLAGQLGGEGQSSDGESSAEGETSSGEGESTGSESSSESSSAE